VLYFQNTDLETYKQIFVQSCPCIYHCVTGVSNIWVGNFVIVSYMYRTVRNYISLSMHLLTFTLTEYPTSVISYN
jgi:hypothetical protein